MGSTTTRWLPKKGTKWTVPKKGFGPTKNMAVRPRSGLWVPKTRFGSHQMSGTQMLWVQDGQWGGPQMAGSLCVGSRNNKVALARGWRTIDSAFHENFDSVSNVERFPYAAQTGDFELESANPCLLVQLLHQKSAMLRRRWDVALQRHGKGTERDPWRVVLGFDEFCPGDKFDYNRSKSVMCFYFTFVELDAACEGSLWFCPMVIRTTSMDSVVGGASRVLACLLHMMFLGVHGFSTVGSPFRTPEGRDRLVFATLGNLISDGDGLRKGLAWKGHGSLKPSLIHDNVVMKNSDLVGRVPGYVEITCTDHRLLHKTTLAEFQDSCDLVAEAHDRYHTHWTISKGMLDRIIKTEGKNYVPGGVPFDLRLRGRVNFFEAVTMDWVHTFLQDGVLTVQAWLMINAAAVTPDALRDFLRRAWRFPNSMQSKGQLLWRIFSDWRLDDQGRVDKVRASASELLGLYSLLRHYFHTEFAITPALRPHWDCFQACCAILDMILAAKRGDISPREAANALRQRIRRFLELHIACYGTAHVRPKHCWMWAIPEHWERDDKVWDAFIIEREHLIVKPAAERLRSMHRAERTILSGVINSQIASLQTMQGPVHFVDTPISASALPDTLFADGMVVRHMHLRVGDIIFREADAGKQFACICLPACWNTAASMA